MRKKNMTTPADPQLDQLKQELKSLIVKELSLEGVNPGDIADDASLFGDGIGLDSLDAVELVVLLQRHYNIRIKDLEEGRKIFTTLDTLARHVMEHRSGPA
jgi:acyl carrier protein